MPVRGRARCRRARGNGSERKDPFHGHVEIGGDLHAQLQARVVIAAFEISDRLRIDLDRFCKLAPGNPAIAAQQGDSIKHASYIHIRCVYTTAIIGFALKRYSTTLCGGGEAMAGNGEDARQSECEVLIVGGSLVGLSAAAFLGHHGIRAYVVEKHAGTSIHPRAGLFPYRHDGSLPPHRARAGDPRGAATSSSAPTAASTWSNRSPAREMRQVRPAASTPGVERFSPCKRFFMTQQSLEPLLRRARRGAGRRPALPQRAGRLRAGRSGVTAPRARLDSGETRRSAPDT